MFVTFAGKHPLLIGRICSAGARINLSKRFGSGFCGFVSKATVGTRVAPCFCCGDTNGKRGKAQADGKPPQTWQASSFFLEDPDIRCKKVMYKRKVAMAGPVSNSAVLQPKNMWASPTGARKPSCCLVSGSARLNDASNNLRDKERAGDQGNLCPC